MKPKEIIFIIIVGISVALIANDFVGKKYFLALICFFPIFSLICYKLAELLSKKYTPTIEMARFVLVGGFADIIDIKLFQIVILLIPSNLTVKTISFLVAVVIKYIGNRNWVFTKEQKGKINKELSSFLLITYVGLIINVSTFYCATKLIGPQFGASESIWIEISIILSALTAAIWNFLSYKLIVFKKNGSIIQKI